MKVILFVTFAALLATAQSLECYQCSNCENVGDRKPSTCVADTTQSPTDETDTTGTGTETTDETTTEVITTTQSEETPAQPKKFEGMNEVLRNYRSVITRQRRAADDDWFCYEAHYTENDKNLVDRGCVMGGYVDNKCPANLVSSLPGPVSECTLCQNDGCNNGSAIAKLSFIALCIVLIAKLIA